MELTFDRKSFEIVFIPRDDSDKLAISVLNHELLLARIEHDCFCRQGEMRLSIPLYADVPSYIPQPGLN